MHDGHAGVVRPRACVHGSEHASGAACGCVYAYGCACLGHGARTLLQPVCRRRSENEAVLAKLQAVNRELMHQVALLKSGTLTARMLGGRAIDVD